MNVEILREVPASGDVIRFFVQGRGLPEWVPFEEFSGELFTTLLLRKRNSRVLCVGLGNEKTLTHAVFARATAMAMKKLLAIGAKEVCIEVGGFSNHVGSMARGAMLGSYKYEQFLPKERQRSGSLEKLAFISHVRELNSIRERVQSGLTVGECANTARHIGNQPANLVTPERLAAIASRMARKNSIKCKILTEKELRKERFGGLLAVGQGSANPPRLIVLEHKKGPREMPWVTLVGKAMTYDSGGLSLKTPAGLEEMKFDKMGGCTVLGIIEAVARLKLPINLAAIIPAAENMPGGRSYRPGDIITTYSGKTIEVLNTDAEGRVILADALAYARRRYKPEMIVDYATLTGAVSVAIGNKRAGLFTERESIRRMFLEVGEEIGERLWHLPMGDEYSEAVRSKVACVKNSSGRDGAACTAASFLREWVEDTTWAHLDIAGTAWITDPSDHLEQGATGFGVALGVEMLRRRYKV